MFSLSRRKAFRALLATAAAAVAPLAARAMPAPREAVSLLETHVAGTAYYEAESVRHRLAIGDPLVLRREPNNPHDALAIEVYTALGAKLGYVPRDYNPAIARLIDAERLIAAEITEVHDDQRWNDISMRLRLID